jgi:hypothetical protein
LNSDDDLGLHSLCVNTGILTDVESSSESADSNDRMDDSGDVGMSPDLDTAEGASDSGLNEPHVSVNDWQGVVEDVFHTKWPNNNWRILSRLLNIIGCTDRDSDVVLETIRNVDWTLSIPRNVAQLRQVEINAMGINKYDSH